MEIVIAVVFVSIMVGVTLLKKRLPRRVLIPVSLITGVAMLVWLWLFIEGYLYGKMLISVLVLSGWYTAFKTQGKQK